MPPELQSIIASKLDAVPLRNLKLVCKGTDTWTKDPPKLSASEWQQYHSVFEMRARKRRKLQTLGCSGCKKLLDQGLFGDVAAARHTLDKGRLCILCDPKGISEQAQYQGYWKRVFGISRVSESQAAGRGHMLGGQGSWVRGLPRDRIE